MQCVVILDLRIFNALTAGSVGLDCLCFLVFDDNRRSGRQRLGRLFSANVFGVSILDPSGGVDENAVFDAG